jgi:hypothetical protein
MAEITLEDWLQQGIGLGFCGPAVCYTHDGLPTTMTEDLQFEEEDPCVHIIRLYEDEDTKASVEENHSPSIWRATNSGYTL